MILLCRTLCPPRGVVPSVSALAAQDLLKPEQRIAWLDERRSALGAKYDKFGSDEAGTMHITLLAAMAVEASPMGTS